MPVKSTMYFQNILIKIEKVPFKLKLSNKMPFKSKINKIQFKLTSKNSNYDLRAVMDYF